MTGNLSPSLIRTLIPFLFGGLLTNFGVQPDDPTAAVVLTGVIGYVFYAVVRFLEVYGGAKWGYILGIAKSPGYQSGDPVQPAPVGEPTDRGAGEVRLIGLVIIGVIAALIIWAVLNSVL